MSDIANSVTSSLDGSDSELFPCFPYLLQDIWELGSSSKVLLDLLRGNLTKEYLNDLKILDLGCGKGAISIPVIKELKGSLTGIDAVPEFINDAMLKAEEFNVGDACNFYVSDMREEIGSLSGYNLILLSSIGPVFGNVRETLNKLIPCLSDNGYIFLDDGFIPEAEEIKQQNVLGELEFYSQIKKSNFEVIDQYVFPHNEMKESNKVIYSAIRQRADELIIKYPDKMNLFEKYLEDQRTENELLENHIKCVSLLLKKKR